MRAYADHVFYRQMYGGRLLDEEQFPAIVQRASAYLDRVTFDRAAFAAGEDAERVQLACCAVADTLAKLERGEVSSEMVGEWSCTWKTDGRGGGRRLYDAALLYLPPSLLFRGVR